MDEDTRQEILARLAQDPERAGEIAELGRQIRHTKEQALRAELEEHTRLCPPACDEPLPVHPDPESPYAVAVREVLQRSGPVIPNPNPTLRLGPWIEGLDRTVEEIWSGGLVPSGTVLQYLDDRDESFTVLVGDANQTGGTGQYAQAFSRATIVVKYRKILIPEEWL